MNKQVFDIAVLGAGAAGLFAAGLLKGKSVVIIEGNKSAGLKVLASGGGLCNFGNKHVSPADYFGANPKFCASALAGFKAMDFAAFLDKRHVKWRERQDGKLFAESSAAVLDALLAEIDKTAVFAFKNKIGKVVKAGDIFEVYTDRQIFCARNVICALGGLSYPALGATGAAYDIAKSFGLRVTPVYPALTGVLFGGFAPLAGISCAAALKCAGRAVQGDILFTHGGLSGPAVFDLSLHNLAGKEIIINFLPGADVKELLLKNKTSVKKPSALLHGLLPKRLLETLAGANDGQISNLNKAQINALAQNF
ncbi:MAG: aminoacetone oxidase family FAD-binding enzyme, partial [Elusimicrobiota bacterium]|nr:aminoacetone oxidase family FAD-binding enzyme [Elusimicrobiota bacterium]